MKLNETKKQNKLILSSQFITQRDSDDIEYIVHALLSNQELSGGSTIVTKYEHLLCERFKTKHAIAVSSGTAAIHCALSALNIKAGDEVIVPVTAVVMTALPVLALKAVPIFVDCEKDSFESSLEDLEKKITPQTKCIISVPMWGYPTYSQRLYRIAQSYQIPIIADVAQAIGSTYMGRQEGTHEICGCFSTHELKLISTGEGGFILTNDPQIATKIRSFSRLGFSAISNEFGLSIGLNYKLNSLAAALGIAQLNKLDTRLAQRKENAHHWLNNLDTINFITPLKAPFPNSILNYNYYATLFLMKHSPPKANLSQILNDLGINTDPFRYNYKLLCNYPIFEKIYKKHQRGNPLIDFPNALSLLSRLIVLPTHENINQSKIKRASEVISLFFDTSSRRTWLP